MSKLFTEKLSTVAASENTKLSLKESFLPFYEQIEEWGSRAEALIVTSVDQIEEMKQARVARLALQKIRTSAEEKRKELKEESLRKGKAIDGIANVIKFQIIPIEKHLKDQEDFAKNEAERIKKELTESRIVELSKYNVDTQFMSLGDMPEDKFEQLLNDSRITFNAKKEAAEKEAAEKEQKIKAEKQAALAPDKIKLENLAYEVLNTNLPELQSNEAKILLKKVKQLLSKTSSFILESSKNL